MQRRRALGVHRVEDCASGTALKNAQRTVITDLWNPQSHLDPELDVVMISWAFHRSETAVVFLMVSPSVLGVKHFWIPPTDGKEWTFLSLAVVD